MIPTHLRSLVAVADTGSFTAAAASLGVTQSGVSQAVAALEDALGVKLVARSRRGAELTAAGERIVEHARAALDAIGRMRAEAQGARGLKAARLRIAGFPSVFATLLPAVLHRFRTLHPGITVTALEVDDREVETLLEAGKVDLGVILNPAGGRAAAILGQDSWRPVFPPGHRLARRPAVKFSELADEAFVLATGGCAVNPRSLAAAAGMSLRNVQIEVRDFSSAIALVREGAGIALVPESTLPDNRRGLRIGEMSPPLERVFGIVATARWAPSAAAQAFLDTLQPRTRSRGRRPAH